MTNTCPHCGEKLVQNLDDDRRIINRECIHCHIILPPGDHAPTVTDAVQHPPHYNAHPSGIECITVTEHMNFNLGNAVKYIWRAGLKSKDAITDLEKARWYCEREIERLTRGKP